MLRLKTFSLIMFFLLALSSSCTEQREPDIGIIETSPAWSPDGHHIAFISNQSGNQDIWVIRADGSDLKNLTNNNPGFDGDFSWSPNSRSIAFGSDSAGEFDIWIFNLETLQTENLTQDFDFIPGNAVWSPDGQYIAFVAQKNDQSLGIWTLSLADGEFSALTHDLDGSFYSPHWSPDSSNLAFLSNIDSAGAGIWIADVSNGDVFPVELLGQARSESNIEWSPTDNWIASANLEDGNIWLIDPFTRDMINLTPESAGSVPVWSRDGKKIAYYSIADGSLDIWIVNVDGLDMTNLTADYNGKDVQPDWSPDGSRIAFVSDRSGQMAIWIMNSDGSNPEKLTD